VARAYGAQPRFILASATVQNAAEHAANLTGLEFSLVEEDGAPKGGKDFIFWDPPLTDELKGTRRSANIEAASIMGQLVSREVRSLCFTRTRRLAELVAATCGAN
jgi:DEAD/DEAH box helicase domain-containing protein